MGKIDAVLAGQRYPAAASLFGFGASASDIQ
jgi:hypothetical protein